SSWCSFLTNKEVPAWPVKRDASPSPPTNTPASPRLATHASLLKGSRSVPDSSSAAPNRTSPPTFRSPTNSAATPTRSPAGAPGSSANAFRVCVTSRGVVARGLFPPEERHQVVVLATTKPAAVGIPVSHWSLEDLATKILQDAHYRDMSRSTIQ